MSKHHQGAAASGLRPLAALFNAAATAAVTAAALSGCTTINTLLPFSPPPAAGMPYSAAPLPPVLPPAPPPSPLRPFAQVVKDAKEIKGFIPLWLKDEKAWLELHPDQLNKPLFLSSSLVSGLGQERFLPGLTGQEQVVEFHRVGNTIQLVAKNLRVRAPHGTPLERALAESFSDSLLGVAGVLSAPHPENKTFLVDATTLLGSDIAGAMTALEAAYRLPYSHDRANSTIERALTDEHGTSLTIKMHFVLPKLPVLPARSAGSQANAMPQPPRVVPDPRSLFLTFTHTLMPLPETPMAPRLADERVGHFTDAFIDLGNEMGLDSRTHYVNRWRLEKKESDAVMSAPKEPIQVIMDRNIPEKYRPAVQAGILEWNKAFEHIGFKDAIVVHQQGADEVHASTDHGRHIAVRWFVMEGADALAVGPSQTDTRTGEIMRAAVIIPENWVRINRTSVAESLPRPSALTGSASSGSTSSTGWGHSHKHGHGSEFACSYAHDAIEQLGFGMDLLVQRGAMDPQGPEADQFVFDSLKEVTMHEMGHALGLRHNFKASTGLSLAQLRNPAYVRTHGISNSVMDYIPLNLPLDREPASVYSMTTLGQYDYWAIEYAYAPIAPEKEKAELAKIAARQAGNPALAYATDEDVAGGLDPTINPFDLGNDPLTWYQRRLTLARELWARTQSRELKEGESFALYRRNVQRGLNQFNYVASLALKYIGGVSTSREVPATAGKRSLLVPVPAQQQRRALDLLMTEYFAADSFRFDPNFMQRLGVDQLDRLAGDAPQFNTDFSLPTRVLEIQRGVLDPLMSDVVAQRLADAESKVSAAQQSNLLSYTDVQTSLREAVWSELNNRNNIDSMRRNLQREHVKRLAYALVRPTSTAATDVRAVHRQVALKLEADLRRVLNARPANKINATTRAHLTEALATLEEALKAPLIKGAV